jgi:LDH2 family malate/lactate/ureidoglycolate dehydrogenase
MVKIKIDEVTKQLAKAASKYVSEREALYFSQCSIDSHLRKAPRVSPIQEAVDDITIWRQNKNKKIETIVDKNGIMLIDFHGLAPSLKIQHFHDEIERKAQRNGIAAIGFRNSSGINTLNMWASELAKRNMIGLCMFNGGTECCVPPGAKQGVMGTNPMAYGVPTENGPILLDMATTEIPFFELSDAKEKKSPLKPGVALDRNGKPTTDASQVLDDSGRANLLPMGGGFKGYGIVMLIEILTGPLIRSLLSTEQTPGWMPTEYGFLMIGIDIDSFVDPGIFKREVSKMCAVIRSLRPAEGFNSVQLPGDRGDAQRKRLVASGEIDVDAGLVESLRLLAQ